MNYSRKEIKRDICDVSDHFPLLCEINIYNIFTHITLVKEYKKWKSAETNSLAA